MMHFYIEMGRQKDRFYSPRFIDHLRKKEALLLSAFAVMFCPEPVMVKRF
jgi:hypothetical protein